MSKTSPSPALQNLVSQGLRFPSSANVTDAMLSAVSNYNEVDMLHIHNSAFEHTDSTTNLSMDDGILSHGGSSGSINTSGGSAFDLFDGEHDYTVDGQLSPNSSFPEQAFSLQTNPNPGNQLPTLTGEPDDTGMYTVMQIWL